MEILKNLTKAVIRIYTVCVFMLGFILGLLVDTFTR